MTGGFPARYGGRLSSVLDVHSAEEVRPGHARHRGAVGAGVDRRARRHVRRRQGHVDDRRPSHVRRQVRRSDQHATSCPITSATSRRTSRTRSRRRPKLVDHGVRRARRARREHRDVRRLDDRRTPSGGTFRLRLGQSRRRRVAHEDARIAQTRRASRAGCSATARRSSSARRMSTFSTTLDLGAGLADAEQLASAIGGSPAASRAHGATHERSFGYDVASYGIKYDAHSARVRRAAVRSAADADVGRRCTSTTSGACRRRCLLETGVRAEALTGRDWLGVSPRVSAKYFLTKDFALTGGRRPTSRSGRTRWRAKTFPFACSTSGSRATRSTPVSSAWHYILGTERWFDADALRRASKASTRSTTICSREIRRKIRAAAATSSSPVDGDSYGVDVLLRQFEQRAVQRLDLVHVRRGGARRANGVRYFPGHDRRHDVNVVGSWRLSKYLFGVRYGYATGTPYTDIVGEIVRRVYDPGHERVRHARRRDADGVHRRHAQRRAAADDAATRPRRHAQLSRARHDDRAVSERRERVQREERVPLRVRLHQEPADATGDLASFPSFPSAGVTIQF